MAKLYTEYEQISSARALSPWFICQEFAHRHDAIPGQAREWLNLWTSESEQEAHERYEEERFFKGRHIRLLKVENIAQELT